MAAPDLSVLDVKPFIGAKDFDASRRFYTALGWRVTYDSVDLLVLDLQGRQFYLQRYYDKAWCHNTMLHVDVENVDDWFTFVSGVFDEHGFDGEARMDGSLQDAGYARKFHVWDPSGVLLHFAQSN